MRIFSLTTATWLPRPLSEVFPFFADAHNLEKLTPPWLRFEVLSREPIKMNVGAHIDYRLRLRGVPIRWQSEITAWQPPNRFVDEQRQGPYRIWIHEHRFREKNGNTLAIDFVRYAVHGGRPVNRLFVARELRRIFEYRRSQMHRIFGTLSGDPVSAGQASRAPLYHMAGALAWPCFGPEGAPVPHRPQLCWPFCSRRDSSL